MLLLLAVMAAATTALVVFFFFSFLYHFQKCRLIKTYLIMNEREKKKAARPNNATVHNTHEMNSIHQAKCMGTVEQL